MKSALNALLTLAVVFALAASTVGAVGPTEQPIAVQMTNSPAYSTKQVRIKAGQSVQWINTSQIAHSVTADPTQAMLAESVELPDGAQPFNSGVLDPGETFTRTFNHPGTYQYFCMVHETVKMRGTVVVE